MKKYILIATTIFTIMATFASCGSDDEEEAGLTYNDITITAGETHTIESGSNWQSEEPLIASISNNIITAERIGTARIYNESASFNITVTPQYNLYNDPCMEWGASPSRVQSFMNGHEQISSKNSIVTYTGGKAAEAYAYMFENNRLTSSAVLVNAELYDESLASFLLERYVPISIDEENYMFFFINIEQDMLVTLGLKTSGYTVYALIMYTPYNQSDAKTRVGLVGKMKEEVRKLDFVKPADTPKADLIIKTLKQKLTSKK